MHQPTAVILLTAFSAAAVVLGQQDTNLFPFREKGKFGFMDEDGKTMIRPSFSRVGDFSEKLAAIEDNGKFGFINKAGVTVIPPQFDGARRFSEGYAAVRLGHNWGYVDRTGSFLIPPSFQAAGEMHDGLARVATWTKFACFGEPSQIGLLEAYASSFEFPSDSHGILKRCRPDDIRVGFINPVGRVVVPMKFFDASDFHDGLAKVRVDGPAGKLRYIDKSGNATPGSFQQAGDFSEGLAAVQLKSDWSYINKAGAFVFPASFEFTERFSEGLGAGRDRKTGKCGYLNHGGVIQIRQIYDRCGAFSDGLALVRIENDTDSPPAFFIDRNGNKVCDENIKGAGSSVPFFSHNLARVEQDGVEVYMNRAGKVVRQYETR